MSEQLKVMGRCNLTPRLSALAGIPTLVVSGRHDPIAPPAYGRAIAAGIPKAQCLLMGKHGTLADLWAAADVIVAETGEAVEE